jgi:hypothetical protein
VDLGRVLLLTVCDGFVCAHEARRPNHIHDEGSSEQRFLTPRELDLGQINARVSHVG